MIIKFLFKNSRWIHKYLGLFIILFLVWMSLSGILLNHPRLISGISVPAWLIPDHYMPHNWNRSGLISAVFTGEQTMTVYFAGKQGIWRSTDNGYNFHRFEKGFETSAYYKKTKQLLLLNQPDSLLLAATDGGLYQCKLKDGVWRPVPLGNNREAVRKIIPVNKEILVFTDSNVYKSYRNTPAWKFKKVDWPRSEPQRMLTLVDLFFHLHDGRIWGLPGKILFDFTGLIIVFLSASAFYIWYFPKRLKRASSIREKIFLKRKAGFFRLFNRYHRKLGIWLAVILLIIGGTAFFMRPPMLAVIANESFPAKYYPGFLPENPWEETVHNVLYDSIQKTLLVNTKNGEWVGSADFSKPFEKISLKAPIFVMGATVFNNYGEEGYIIGSFNGLFHWERKSGKFFDLINKKYSKNWSNVRPADQMVTGYFKTPDGEEFITAHEQGLLPLSGNNPLPGSRFSMPRQMRDEFRMSLWNYLFEFHNARFFRGWIGGYYILIAPLGSIIFVLITLSGIYDWVYIKLIHRKNVRKRLVR